MKKKYLVLIGLLLPLAVFLSGCAGGLTASAWPAMTADAKNVYLAGGPYVYAVNLQTGAQVWRFPASASAANPFYAAPVLSPDGQLIVGGFDKKLYSLNPQTGLSNWQFTNAHDRYFGGVLVANNMIYAPNADYNLYALDMKGQLQWTFEADQSIWGAPVSDGTNIFFGTNGRKLYAVDAKTGKQAWMQDLDGAVLGSPLLGSTNELYVGTYGGTLYALSTANGKTLWSKPAFPPSSWIWTGPVMDTKNLYVGDSYTDNAHVNKGRLVAYPISGADKLWSLDLNGAIIGSPCLCGDKLVVGTEAGSVYFVDPIGKILQTISLSTTMKVYATPLTAGTLTLVAPSGGTSTEPVLLALDAAGATKWSFIPPK
jgi:outer membrane protein assembly factor BamB